MTTERGRAVAEVCERLLAENDYDATSVPARALAERALAEFAARGLLRLRFLETGMIAEGDMTELGEIVEAFAARSHTLMSLFLINAVFGAAAVAFFGSSEQKRRLLPEICQGKCQTAFALTECGAGSDAAAIEARYRRSDGGYRLNGIKYFTTGAEVADYLLVVAREEGAAAGTRAESIFIVPRDAPGLTVEPLPKLAGNVHASCRVRIENVAVADDTILGGAKGVHQAWPALRRLGLLERCAVACASVGLAGAVVQRTFEYARVRRQFDQPIASLQSIQFMLVDMKTLERTMCLLVQHAARALEADVDAVFAVCSAKAYCAEKLQELVAAGMRILGGRAYFDFEPMSRYYREAPWMLYAGGTVEIQKRTAARALGIG